MSGPEVIEASAARSALERTIAAGGIALFPADGLYGLACDPLNAAAIERIHGIKGRDDGKPSAVMYFSPLILRELIGSMGSMTQAAAATLLPGPVTLVIANPEHRYPLACRDEPGQLGIRLIDGPLAGASCPIFQSSANCSGQPAPASYGAIDVGVLEAVDLAIDGGALTGEPSTVVDLTRIESDPRDWAVLREGGLEAVELERALAGIG